MSSYAKSEAGHSSSRSRENSPDLSHGGGYGSRLKTEPGANQKWPESKENPSQQHQNPRQQYPLEEEEYKSRNNKAQSTPYKTASTKNESSSAFAGEFLHKDFKIHPSKKFKFGHVFKILWTEPKGQELPGNPKRTDAKVYRTKYGEEYYTSIRRYVIVKEGKGHSLCVPILVYRFQATKLHDINSQDHAIIYTKDKNKVGGPNEAPGEVRLLLKPIRVEPKSHRDRLHELSRLNYAKVYTVEHNVKVCFIGKIHPGSIRQFIKDFNESHTLRLPDLGQVWETDEDILVKEANSKVKQACDPSLDNYQQRVERSEGDINENFDITSGLIMEKTSPPKNLHKNPKVPSRRNSVASMSMSASSMFDSDSASSVSTYTDASSFISSIDLDPLIALFTEDDRLSSLFSKASQLMPVDSLVNKMRHMLLKFGKNLRSEAKSDIEKKATRIIKLQARNIALGLSRKVYPIRLLRVEDPAYRISVNLERWMEDIEPIGFSDGNANDTDQQEDEASESEGDENGGEKDNLHQNLIDSFIKPSKALTLFRQEFAQFLESHEAKSRAAKGTALPKWPAGIGEEILDTRFKADRAPSFDHILSVLGKIWHKNDDHLSNQMIQYQACWDVQNFLSNYFVNGQQLESIITLTGDANDAEALPCGQYLRKTWPAVGDVLLASIEELIRTSTRGHAETPTIKIEAEFAPGLQYTSTTNRSLIIFSIHAQFEQHYDAISAISWLCAAVRHGDSQGLSVSKSFIETTPRTDKTRKILIKLFPLVPITENELCWHSLFAHTVIAYDFPISPRKVGHGLELSFQAMLMLARSSRVADFNNGLIAEGLENLVIPVAILGEDDAIQWHLEWKDRDRTSAEILLEDIFLTRYKTTDLQELAEKRTFLGWTENALVMLGTERFNQIYALENIK